jgi:hypothetical protein
VASIHQGVIFITSTKKTPRGRLKGPKWLSSGEQQHTEHST